MTAGNFFSPINSTWLVSNVWSSSGSTLQARQRTKEHLSLNSNVIWILTITLGLSPHGKGLCSVYILLWYFGMFQQLRSGSSVMNMYVPATGNLLC